MSVNTSDRLSIGLSPTYNLKHGKMYDRYRHTRRDGSNSMERDSNGVRLHAQLPSRFPSRFPSLFYSRLPTTVSPPVFYAFYMHWSARNSVGSLSSGGLSEGRERTPYGREKRAV